jgi:GTPase SAR1 family protein
MIYRGALGAIIVFDINFSESLENVTKWIDEFQKYTSGSLPLVLIGNKIDLVK